MAAGPSASAAAFCATARMSPVDGLITTSIALRPWVSTACWAAFCTGRSSVIDIDGAGCGATSLRMSTSAPFWLTLTTRQPASPSSWSITAFLTWPMMAGAKRSSVGSRSACGVTTTPGSPSSTGPTLSWSDGRSVISSSGLLDELASSASRCGSRVSSNCRKASATTREVFINSPPACAASSW